VAQASMNSKTIVSPGVPDWKAPVVRFGLSVWAISLRELRSRYGKRRLGVFWAMVEPAAYIVGLTFVLSFVHDQSPLRGSLAPFIATGLMPYMLLNSTEHTVRGAVRRNMPLLVFPRIKPIGLFLGRWIIETATLLMVFMLMFTMFIVMGISDAPAELHRMLAPLALASLAGFSLGILNAVIIAYAPVWESVWQIVARVNFLTAGVFFLASNFPAGVIKYLEYQPTLHLIEWVRSGFYANYESPLMDPAYPAVVVVLLLLSALLFERVFRSRLMRER
jgi:capsular polysaccharide transport system permease protein